MEASSSAAAAGEAAKAEAGPVMEFVDEVKKAESYKEQAGGAVAAFVDEGKRQESYKEQMASGGAEVIKQLRTAAPKKGSTNGGSMSAVVPVDKAHAPPAKLNWSRKTVTIPVGDSVLWMWHDEVELKPKDPSWFDQDVPDSSDKVISRQLEEQSEEGTSYALKFNKLGTYRFRTEGGGRADKNQTTFKVNVVSLQWEAWRKLCCWVSGYIAFAVVFGLVVIVPLAVLQEGTLVTSLLSMVSDNEAQQDVVKRFAGKILVWFWPPLIGAVFILIFLPCRIFFTCLWPKPLTSYGRGFHSKTHRDVRIVLAAFAFVGFLLVMIAWSYMGSSLDGMKPVMEKTLEIGDQQLVEISAMLRDTEQYQKISSSSLGGSAVPDMIKLADDARTASESAEGFLQSAVHTMEALGFMVMQLALITYAMAFAASLSKKPHLTVGTHFMAMFTLLLHLLIGAMCGIMLAIFKGINDEVNNDVIGSGALDGGGSSSDFSSLIAYCSDSGGSSAMGSMFESLAESMQAAGGAASVITFPSPEEAKSITVAEMRTFVASATQNTNELLANRDALVSSGAAGMDETLLGLSIMQRLFKLSDCTTMKTGLHSIRSTFFNDVVSPFESLWICNILNCAILACIIVASAVAAHVLERPRKFWHCAKTGRWFRFRACYKAHVRLNERESSWDKRLGMVVRTLQVWKRPMFTAVNFWSELSLAFIVAVFVVFSQGLLLLVFSSLGSGDSSFVPMTIAKVLMMVGALLALAFVYAAPGRRNEVISASLYVSLSMKIAALSLLIFVAYEEGTDFYSCKDSGLQLTGDCAVEKVMKRGKLVLEATVCAVTLLICMICGLGFYFARAAFLSDQEETAALSFMKKHNKIENQNTANTFKDDLEDAKQSMTRCRKFAQSKKAIPVYFLLVVLAALVSVLIIKVIVKKEDKSAESQAEKAAAQARAYTWCYSDDCCNGLSSLCSRRYDQVVWATSHNAYCSAEDKFTMPAHHKSFVKSLEAGVRTLMFDLVTEVTGPTKLCHKYCSLGSMELHNAFSEINTFLGTRTTEVVTIMFEQILQTNRTKDEQFDDIEQALTSSGLLSRVHTQAHEDPWPTLEQMKGKVVLFTYLLDPGHEADPTSPSRPRKYLHHQQSFIQENKYQYSSRTALLGASACTRNQGHSSSPLMLVNHFITSPGASASWAAAINYFTDLKDHAERCRNMRSNKVPNFLSVDFWSIGDVVAVALELNKEPVPAGSVSPSPACTHIIGDGGHSAGITEAEAESRYVPVTGGQLTCTASSATAAMQLNTQPAGNPECSAVWLPPGVYPNCAADRIGIVSSGGNVVVCYR